MRRIFESLCAALALSLLGGLGARAVAQDAQPPGAQAQEFSTDPRRGSSVFRTADEAAQRLYQAWRTKNRAAAASAADAAAWEKLFGVRWRAMRFGGCQKREEGDFECFYSDVRNDLSLAMLAGKTQLGFWIRSLSFSSEAM